jgi:hypothetical protein
MELKKAAGSCLLRCQEFYEKPGKFRPIRRIGDNNPCTRDIFCSLTSKIPEIFFL